MLTASYTSDVHSALRERLDAIDWSKYETAYGNAAGPHAFETAKGKIVERWGSIADQLERLASRDRSTAMDASHHLWCSLCHQHAYVSSAALPALPFLLEVLDEATDQLKVEILEILTGFAECSTPQGGEPDWHRELRSELSKAKPRFEALTQGEPNVEICNFAERILAALRT